MVKLKEEGLIRNIGLSEVDADTLRRANAVHPVHSVEVEYSLLNREAENELIPAAKELGIQVTVYGAVGHGVLTDKVINGGISNPMMARGVLSPLNKKHNLQIFSAFAEIAKKQGFPEHFLSSLEAVNAKLDAPTVAEIEKLVSTETIKGHTMRKWIFENGVGRMVSYE